MKTIIVAGGNLFRVAASALGDATQWIRLARANDLSDPTINGIVELKIPDTDPSAGGGIVRQ